jgi:regulator of sirC expression with transglutaminase-like and TPR domain
MEIGRRLGMRLHGVGMPGHFLVMYTGPGEEIVIDPFHAGMILSHADCQRILDRIYDGKLAFEPRLLAILGTRQILARMLNNLKAIYFKAQEYARALSVVDRLLILDPRAATEIRDRGLLSCQLKRFPEAMADLERYLGLAPEAEDAEVIRAHLRSIRERVATLN